MKGSGVEYIMVKLSNIINNMSWWGKNYKRLKVVRVYTHARNRTRDLCSIYKKEGSSLLYVETETRVYA